MQMSEEENIVPEVVEPVVEATQEPVVEEAKTVSQDDFNKVYFQLKQAERDMVALKNAQPVTQQPVAEVNAPTIEEFDYDDDKYQAASIQYQVKEQVNAALKAQTDTHAQATQAQAVNDRNTEFNKKAEAYATANPDYNRAIQAAEGLVFPQHIQEVLLTSEVGPQLDYMMINDLSLFQKISSMPPTMAVMELGRMEGVINTTITPNNAISNAPAPVETVGGVARSTGDYRYDEGVSMDDYYKQHQAALKAKG